jgi:hypothetical protein
MKLGLSISAVVLAVMVAAGCANWFRTEAPVYQDDFLKVWLESNPDKAGSVQGSRDAPVLTAQQLARVLKGVEGRKVTGWLKSIVDQSPQEPVFLESELPLVSRELLNGLRSASAQERVAFRLSRAGAGRTREETVGSLFMRGSLLYLTLTKFRFVDRMAYEGAEGGSGKEIELSYEPSDALVQRQQGFTSQWLGADRAEVIVDVRKVTEGPLPAGSPAADRRAEPPVPAQPPQASAVAPPAKSESAGIAQAPSAAVVESFQRQVKELTDSNQELRASLKTLQDRQDQGAALTEELIRLRQELAETKQLLAEKVLELNRLKNKSVGTDKRKKPAGP